MMGAREERDARTRALVAAAAAEEAALRDVSLCRGYQRERAWLDWSTARARRLALHDDLHPPEELPLVLAEGTRPQVLLLAATVGALLVVALAVAGALSLGLQMGGS
jgi:hypothetical protein